MEAKENQDPNKYTEEIRQLKQIFPDICLQFLSRFCHNQHNLDLNALIDKLLQIDYPKSKNTARLTSITSLDKQLEIVKQMLPDANPAFLAVHCERLFDRPRELHAFLDKISETGDYPTMKDYLTDQQLSAQQKQYTDDFRVENFLKAIPDPEKYFNDPNRKVPDLDEASCCYVQNFLANQYPFIPYVKIKKVMGHSSLQEVCKELDGMHRKTYLKHKRPKRKMPELINNIPVLQEISYIQHKNEIAEHVEQRKAKEEQQRQDAKAYGLLETCNCCYSEEIMPDYIFTCEEGCKFCKDCVLGSVQVAFGDGKLDFPCLDDCHSHFSLRTLQAVLNPKMFSILALKKQVQEVKAAGLEDLENCPFCDFVTIPTEEDKLFHCLNPVCMKESCRSCKQPSHIPLKCSEIELDEEVKKRIYIENKMTEALVRKCYKCSINFVKEEGCNKMTCSCGAMMCYLCYAPVSNYTHFNGPGGDKYNLCPLYSDTHKLHEESVLRSAKQAKIEMGIDKSPSKLKHDPSADVSLHYKEQAFQKINNFQGHL